MTLKPCPFCSGSARTFSSKDTVAVECSECPAAMVAPVVNRNAEEKLARIIDRWNSSGIRTRPRISRLKHRRVLFFYEKEKKQKI